VKVDCNNFNFKNKNRGKVQNLNEFKTNHHMTTPGWCTRIFLILLELHFQKVEIFGRNITIYPECMKYQ